MLTWTSCWKSSQVASDLRCPRLCNITVMFWVLDVSLSDVTDSVSPSKLTCACCFVTSLENFIQYSFQTVWLSQNWFLDQSWYVVINTEIISFLLSVLLIPYVILSWVTCYVICYHPWHHFRRNQWILADNLFEEPGSSLFQTFWPRAMV